MSFHILPRRPTTDVAPIARVTRFWFVNEFLVYIAVVAAGFARDCFLRYRARREETIRLQAHAAQLQAQLSDARLAALRAQLDPHFLFNTLHAVSALVEHDPRGVRRMIARLSELLRNTLEGANEPEIPLEQELAFLKRYLEIMEIRFRGRLEVDIQVETELGAALVPNLILQPLAENAIKHGVSKIDGTGRIEIRVVRHADQLILRVRDNGPGLIGQSSSEGVGLRKYARTPAATLRAGTKRELARGRRRWRDRRSHHPYHTRVDLSGTPVAARRRIWSVSERKPLRVVIADDEMLARQRLQDLLAREKAVEIVGQVDNGEAAVAAIEALKPDLVFLDVQMPGKTGVEVARTVGLDKMPATIFVTAYDHYALKAFDLAAIDYLVKPFDDERFEQAFRRARRMVELQEVDRLSEHLLALLQGAQREVTPVRSHRTTCSASRSNRAARCGSLPWSKSNTSPRAARTRATCWRETYVIRERMQSLEEQLDPAQFFRIHRSSIVRLDQVDTLLRDPGGDYAVRLKSGTKLDVSRNRVEQIEKWMGLQS